MTYEEIKAVVKLIDDVEKYLAPNKAIEEDLIKLRAIIFSPVEDLSTGRLIIDIGHWDYGSVSDMFERYLKTMHINWWFDEFMKHCIIYNGVKFKFSDYKIDDNDNIIIYLIKGE